MNITFDDNLITGNKTIDSQHQELIDRTGSSSQHANPVTVRSKQSKC